MSSSIKLVEMNKTGVFSKKAGPIILPAKGKMGAPVHIFASPRLPPEPDEMAALSRLSQLPYMEKIVALPDLHIKPKLEAPSSIAAAVRDHLILGLSSPSPNCGMAAALTGLYWEDIGEEQLDVIFTRLAETLPIKPLFPSLTEKEMDEVLIHGPRAVIERYGFDESVLERMDWSENLLDGEKIKRKEILDSIPAILRKIGRGMFGQVGRGNHFLELQVVDQILDSKTAKAWGLNKGQVLFMYHADSGYLGAFVGRLYAHRIKNNWRGRVFEWRLKLPHHIRYGSTNRLLKRVKTYMLPKRFSIIPADSEEGRFARAALLAAGNYADANRLAVLASIRNALMEIWLNPEISPVLLWDAPHNSIRLEQVEGENLWVHRHNAIRVRPRRDLPHKSLYSETGHPVLIPGTERTLSYLCASGDGAGQALYSADHGAGRSALRLARLQEENFTRVYGYDGPPARRVFHLSDDGVREVIDVLSSADIANPVAALRPAAVLKAHN
jgi:tRNA-splicing ligase RtcB (3'-phosphate/5'-hydroxy nucleic acid ligase)